MIKIKLKTWHKNVLSLLAIIFGGFILFNLAFMLAAFVINATMKIMGISQNSAPHYLSWVIYLILIFIISFVVFRSKINTLFKATFLTLPLMLILALIGLTFYQQTKFFVAVIGGLFIVFIILFLYKKKMTWQYYFATLYVAVLGICIMAFNIQI